MPRILALMFFVLLAGCQNTDETQSSANSDGMPLDPVEAMLADETSWEPVVDANDTGMVDHNQTPVLPSVGASQSPAINTSDYAELDWLELVPDDFSFELLFEQVQAKFPDVDFMLLEDDDGRAIEALDYLRELTDQAPARTDLDGKKVRVPGFLIPLDPEGFAISNFLLVPYYGACIHTPPPPANQVIVVRSATPFEQVDLFAPVWVNGVISAVRYEDDLAAAGYEVAADLVEPYEYF